MLTKIIDSESVRRVAQWVNDYEKFVIIGHTSPDGDAVGSALALGHYLDSKGKQAQVVMPNAFPDFYKWMPGSEDVLFYRTVSKTSKSPERIRELIAAADVICCLDFNSLHRIDELGPLVKAARAKKLLLDHHLSADGSGRKDTGDFADLAISRPEQSSTCELLFRLLQDLGHYEEMSTETAACLYTGMMTDTGGFIYNSTRGEIFHIVGMLLDKGIDKDVIYRKVNFNFTSARMRLQGLLLSHMTYLPKFHTVIIYLDKATQERMNYHRGDSEGFANLPLSIRDVVLTCFLREDTERDEIKFSLRSVGNFSCEEMAKRLGGGGHKNAAGAEKAGVTIKQAKYQFIGMLKDFQKQLHEAYKEEINRSYREQKS